jgi:DNA-binding NtrC family response regulator
MSIESSAHVSLLGRCGAMEELRAGIAQLAPSDVRVHISGETGTGKEKVARALHRLSSRARGPFVAVNVAGFTDELFASELFGHAKGAFTGAVASREGHVAGAEGGTLFIDEVADMSGLAQVRLLRFLQEREYLRVGETRPRRADVRIVSATNVDLGRRVREGRFRQDLLYRLREAVVVVPPLRERGGDILLLARHFLRMQAAARGERASPLAPCAEAALLRHGWPGNVRELEGEMRRLGAVARGRQITAADLAVEIRGKQPAPRRGGLRAALDRAQYEIIRHTLARHDGVKARAARELGITRQALGAKLRRLQSVTSGA